MTSLLDERLRVLAKQTDTLEEKVGSLGLDGRQRLADAEINDPRPGASRTRRIRPVGCARSEQYERVDNIEDAHVGDIFVANDGNQYLIDAEDKDDKAATFRAYLSYAGEMWLSNCAFAYALRRKPKLPDHDGLWLDKDGNTWTMRDGSVQCTCIGADNWGFTRMIDRSEVPEPVGLMYYDPSKRTLRYRRKPNPSHGDTRQVEHRLLKKLAASERPDRYGHYETAAEYVAQREAMKGIGRALGTKMALRLQQLEQLQEPTEARRIQAQSKAFERVCDILSRHGYQISRWTRTEDLETRLKELDEALSSVVPTGTVDRETLYAISCLQQLRTTLGLQDRKEHGR